MQEIEVDQSGGVGAHTFQVLTKIYDADKGAFRRALKSEVIPLLSAEGPLGKTAQRVIDNLVQQGYASQEFIERLKNEVGVA